MRFSTWLAARLVVPVFVVAFAIPPASFGQVPTPTSERLRALVEDVGAGTRDAVGGFWADMQASGTPLIETQDDGTMLVTFLWRETGPTERVVIMGGPGGYVPADNLMTKLEGTDIWYRTFQTGPDLRTVYRFSPNDSLVPFAADPDIQTRMAGFRIDPLNPKTFVFPADPSDPTSVETVVSVVELPDAPAQPWIERRAGTARGEVEDHEFHSDILNNERTLSVYTPSGYESGRAESYPLLVVFDRGAYLSMVPTPIILDNLIAAGRIPPLVAVLVGNVDRGAELPCHGPFADFLARELAPWMRSRYGATSDPARTVVAGSSFGGLAATCAAVRHPDVFGNVLSQSGSYWWAPAGDHEPEWPTRQIAETDRLDIRFYLDIGLLESGPTRNGGPSMLVTNRHLRDVLRARGYRVSYHEIRSAHDYLSWRGTLADGLIDLLGDGARASLSRDRSVR